MMMRSEEEQQAISRLGFIFLTYQAPAWWFEVAVMMQKLLMTSGVIFPPFPLVEAHARFRPLVLTLRRRSHGPLLSEYMTRVEWCESPDRFLTLLGDSGVG